MRSTQHTKERARCEVDAAGQTLGRVATRVAHLLRGKHHATYAPHIDAGDAVHVRNLHAVRFTGNKMTAKQYMRHSMYPGGLKRELLRDRWEHDPESVLRAAVYNMLPPTTHRRNMLRRLTVSLSDV